MSLPNFRKYVYIICCLCLQSLLIKAQVPPQGIQYQAVARDNNGDALPNAAITLGFIIHNGSAGGASVYSESHSITTNQFGLFTAVIGTGTVSGSGTLAGVNWGSGSKFLEVIINGTSIGTTQLQSVPYALYANSAGGAILQSGTGLPAGGGNNGDFYIDIGTYTLYGPYSSGGGWGSGTLLKGNNGNTILNGTTAPTPGQGTIGDFYIDTQNNMMYGPKTTGGWPSAGVSLVGPAGSISLDGLNAQTIYYNGIAAKWDTTSTLMVNSNSHAVGIDTYPTFLSALTIKNRPLRAEIFFSGIDTTNIVSLGFMHIGSSDAIAYQAKKAHAFLVGSSTTPKAIIDSSANILLGSVNTLTIGSGLNLGQSKGIDFEGATPDGNKTRLQATDPTASNLLQLPDASGTLMIDPTTASGDLIYRGATGITRLGAGSPGSVLALDFSGIPAWQSSLSLGLISGTNSQTLYNDAGIWKATGNLNHDGSKVGIGVSSPTQTLGIGTGSVEKLNIKGSDGSITFTDVQGSITFPTVASTTNAKPMIHLFASGNTNGSRMVLAHSPNLATTGLEFNDQADVFSFRSVSDTIFSVGLTNKTIRYKDGNEGNGKVLVADPAGVAHWKAASKTTLLTCTGIGGGGNPSTVALQLTNNVSFTKSDAATELEITFQGILFLQSMGSGGSYVYFEIRVDGNPPGNNSGRALLSKDVASVSMYTTFTGIFNNIAAGSHTVNIYVYTDSGNASGVSINKSNMSGGSVYIVKEHY